MEFWQKNTTLCQAGDHVAPVINLRLPRKRAENFRQKHKWLPELTLCNGISILAQYQAVM